MFVTSLPVPQVVGTRMSGCFFTAGNFFWKRSVTGATRSSAKSFATSRIVPPPMAKTRRYSLPAREATMPSTMRSVGSPLP